MDPTTLRLTIYTAALVVIAVAVVFGGVRHLTTLTNVLMTALTGMAALGPKLVMAGGSGQADISRCDVMPWRPWTAVKPSLQDQVVAFEGAEKAERWNSSGETCAAALIQACRGATPSAGDLRATYLFGTDLTVANGAQLVLALAGCHVGATAKTWDRASEIAMLEACTRDGRPAIALGVWPTPGGTAQWIIALYCDGNRVHVMNPWDGTVGSLPYADWVRYSVQSAVVLDSHLLYG